MRVLTIGYGNRDIETFVRLLGAHEVGLLVDVRSRPVVGRVEYRAEDLRARLEAVGVSYSWEGELGGMPVRAEHYTADGRADYEALRAEFEFGRALVRVAVASETVVQALMCAELRPEECHRSRLVGQALHELGIPVFHVDEDGGLMSHADFLAMLARRGLYPAALKQSPKVWKHAKDG